MGRFSAAHITQQKHMQADQLGRVPHPRDRVCEQCGAVFRMRNPSGAARAGLVKEGRFCSRPCSHKASRLYADKSESKRAEKDRVRAKRGLPPLPKRPSSVSCSICIKPFTPRSTRQHICSVPCRQEDMRRKAATYYSGPAHAPRECAECVKTYTPEHGAAVYCGAPCATRAKRRVAHKKERARLRLATVESVNPTIVFNRDRWRCQLCGTPTPRRLRGSTTTNAPELDHIVPLSRGGEHSYRNTQCLCRACNASKGATTKGQLRLFG